MTINTNYMNYGNMFQSGGKVNSASMDNLYKLLSQGQTASKAPSDTAKLAETTKQYMLDVKSGGTQLKGIMDGLFGKGKDGSVFEKRTAVSSDTDYLTIKSVTNDADLGKETKVSISQVATAQANQGTGMAAYGFGFAANTTHKFEIDVAGKKTEFSVYVASGDNNETVQKKIAEAINGKNTGVTAQVAYDTASKTSSLKLESASTGVNAPGEVKFSVRDITGDAMGKTGVDKITQNAANAVYSVNGGPSMESKTNNVDLGNGVTATLKKATTEDVSVTMGKDKTAVVNAVREMVNSYNALLATANDNKDDRGAARLAVQLAGNAVNSQGSLGRIGVSANDKGYLSIDEKKMDAAFENGQIENFFKDKNVGFAARVSQTADRAAGDPGSFTSVTAKSAVNASEDRWNNSGSLTYSMNFRYSQLVSVGSLFDMLF